MRGDMMILCEHCGGREKMNKEFLDAIEANPIIAAVKDEQGLQNCLGREELTVIFILYGDIRSIGGIVERIHQAGKIAMAHIDLITGLSSKDLRGSEKAPGQERIYTAGEKEYDVWMYRKDKGVPVTEAVQKEFIGLRDEFGLTQFKFPFEK